MSSSIHPMPRTLSRAFPFKCTNSQVDENLTTAPMHPRKEPVIFLNWATYIRHLLHWRQPDHVLVDLHSEHHVGRPLDRLPVQVAETQPASFVHEKKNKTLIWYPPDRVYVFMCTFMWFQYEDQFSLTSSEISLGLELGFRVQTPRL